MLTPTSSPQALLSNRVLAGKTEEKFLNAFFVAYKTARIMEEHNAAFKNQLTSLFDTLESLCREEGDVALKTVAGRYFINEKMVRFDDRGLSGAASVIAEWRMLGVGGVQFHNGITVEQLGHFLKFMSDLRPSQEKLESLAQRLKSHGVPHITLLSVVENEPHFQAISEESRKQFRAVARAHFFSAMNVVQEAVVNAIADREINIAKTKRVVHTLIDHISRDESSLMELAAIKNFDDYTYAHSTNVCVYSLTLGVRLGLDRGRLAHLGFSALFHDIGKVKLPMDLIRKPDAYDENDWIQMQRHPLLGAKTILRTMKLDVYSARAARAAFEHHINRDFTGYPTLRHQQRVPDLFSRIISIVDSFDALTSGRVYLKKSMTPDVVFKKMRYQMAIKFDPFLLKLFNDIIGVYPAGSLVLLTTDEIALILTNNEIDRARPYVQIVGNKAGLLDESIWVDLSLPENVDRKIVRQIDPTRYGLDPKKFILTS